MDSIKFFMALFLIILAVMPSQSFAVEIQNCPQGQTFDPDRNACIDIGGGVAVCSEGHTYQSGNNEIQICRNEKLVDYKSCDFGVTSDSQGDAVCVSKQDTTNELLFAILIVLIILAVILYKKSNKTK